MRRVDLSSRVLSEFDSEGVTLWSVARMLRRVDGFAVDVLSFRAGSCLGRHPTRLWQLFTVVSGSGWVSGPDGMREPIECGEAMLWEPGEEHESGSDDGMVVCVVQSPVDPVPRTGQEAPSTA